VSGRLREPLKYKEYLNGKYRKKGQEEGKKGQRKG
jgi:hypothetical protein